MKRKTGLDGSTSVNAVSGSPSENKADDAADVGRNPEGATPSMTVLDESHRAAEFSEFARAFASLEVS
jgi:hypothetical protein